MVKETKYSRIPIQRFVFQFLAIASLSYIYFPSTAWVSNSPDFETKIDLFESGDETPDFGTTGFVFHGVDPFHHKKYQRLTAVGNVIEGHYFSTNLTRRTISSPHTGPPSISTLA